MKVPKAGGRKENYPVRWCRSVVCARGGAAHAAYASNDPKEWYTFTYRLRVNMNAQASALRNGNMEEMQTVTGVLMLCRRGEFGAERRGMKKAQAVSLQREEVVTVPVQPECSKNQ